MGDGPRSCKVLLTGWKELTWPFVAFVLFLVGRVLSLVAFIGTFEILLPGLTEKPFTMYIIIATFFFAPLGLQFFLAFQEFVFYSFSTYQAAFANLVLETRKMSSKSDLKNSKHLKHQSRKHVHLQIFGNSIEYHIRIEGWSFLKDHLSNK